jgi:hypothetical protein
MALKEKYPVCCKVSLVIGKFHVLTTWNMFLMKLAMMQAIKYISV